MVYVCDSVAQAKRDLRDAELRHAYNRMQHVIPPGGSNADLTFEKLIDRGFFICGDPDTVYDGIKNVYDEVGGFGTLLLIYGKDWGTLRAALPLDGALHGRGRAAARRARSGQAARGERAE